MKWIKLLPLALLISQSCCFGQTFPNAVSGKVATKNPKFSITVAPPLGPIRLGAPIVVTITVTNIGAEDLYWASEIASDGHYKDFSFLLMKDGKEVETTFYDRVITGRQRSDDPTEVASGSTILVPYPPGVIVTFKIDLTRLYEIKDSGEYTLDVGRFGDGNQDETVVRSNTLTLKIVAQ